jgi:hypothetical protein
VKNGEDIELLLLSLPAGEMYHGVAEAMVEIIKNDIIPKILIMSV